MKKQQKDHSDPGPLCFLDKLDWKTGPASETSVMSCKEACRFISERRVGLPKDQAYQSAQAALEEERGDTNILSQAREPQKPHEPR